MYSRIYDYILKHTILTEYQFSLRKGYSTEMAQSVVTDKITSALDKGKCSGCILGLDKAFDTVDHTILLLKLYHYVIRAIALQWFKNYLSNRKHFLKYNDVVSSERTVICCVPQGSM